jgi:hypothetical protein
MGRITVFKDIVLPTNMTDIKSQLKSHNYDLYTKMIKNSLMFEKLFSESHNTSYKGSPRERDSENS